MKHKPRINIIGAGAAGLYLASLLSQHKVEINFFDLGKKPGRKILISGGGYCNFTNQEVTPQNYISSNPHFAISALKGHSNWSIIGKAVAAGVTYQIKEQAKYFTQDGAKAWVNFLLDTIESNSVYSQAQVNWYWQTPIHDIAIATPANSELAPQDLVVSLPTSTTPFPTTISKQSDTTSKQGKATVKQTEITLFSSKGNFKSELAVIATGGLAFPRLQVSNWAEEAKGLQALAGDKPLIIPSVPGLVPLAYSGQNSFYKAIAGCSVFVTISNNQRSKEFTHNLLFTHQGFSGPAILQISNYWQPSEPIIVDFLPQLDLAATLESIRHQGSHQFSFNKYHVEGDDDYTETQNELLTFTQSSKAKVKSFLTRLLPTSLVELWASLQADSKFTTFIVKQIQPLLELQIAQLSNSQITTLANFIHNNVLTINQSLGYDKAEVMCGGINTDLLSSKTMAFKAAPQLYAIGECVDVTGQLGGFNFQWCWSSAYAAYKDICMQLGFTPSED